MKTWPADNKPAAFADLVAPVMNAIFFAYDFKRKHKGKDIPWHGPNDVHISDSAYLPSEMLEAESLEISKERGRDALEEIVSVAIQLGIEQGRRMEQKKIKTLQMTVDLLMAQKPPINDGPEFKSIR